MVTEWGMSQAIGPVFLGGEQEVFIGRDYGQTHAYSETLSAQIDAEVHRILEEGRQRAEQVLRENIDKLHILAQTLLDREKISGAEFDRIMAGETLEPLEKKAEELKADLPEEETVSTPTETTEQ